MLICVQKIPFLATRNVANESLKQNGCAQANHCLLRKERTPTSKIIVSIGFRRQQLHLQLICTADTLLQSKTVFQLWMEMARHKVFIS